MNASRLRSLCGGLALGVVGLTATIAGTPAAAPGPATAAASAPAPAATPKPAEVSSCIACHGQLDGPLVEPLSHWKGDVHGEAGLGCESCHGGDASAALATDPEAAMNPAKGFRPAPDRLAVAGFCARCHSDAGYMKRFNPQQRVDQLSEYRSSVHGRLNAQKDPAPATCIDCHGVHGIRPVTSPDSPAYATNVPTTCARCHQDEPLMRRYGKKTGQYEDYRHSVHGAALLERGDTAAPACNDCHGNHGAAPPGATSIAQVCGQCHGREAILFRASFKKQLYDGMGVPECIVCHGNHRIKHPTPDLFHGLASPAVSAGKVVDDDPVSADLGDLAPGSAASTTFRAVLRPHLNPGDPKLSHRIVVSADGQAPIILDATVQPGAEELHSKAGRAASGPLDAKLTIDAPSGLPVEAGDAMLYRVDVRAAADRPLTHVTVMSQPGEGVQPVRGSVCLTCHQPGDSCDKASERMYGALMSLDSDIRRATALLRNAELAGMDVSTSLFELKSKGVTAAVEARALIHSFDPDRLVKRSEEGRQVASVALQAGKSAFAELQYRRKGLAVSLILVGLVLAALYIKIRQVG